MKKLAVVAFGGNALLRGNEIGSIEQQEKNAYDTCKKLIGLIKQDYNVIITHGNGPQVGNILLRNEAGYEKFKIPKMPLDICVADSQGGIGYMIERQMRNILVEEKMKKNVVSFITQVMVDREDPAFENPTKPIGPFYIKEEADLLAKANNWQFHQDPRKRGWRRVVASPKPIDVLNKKIIRDVAKKGNIVIAAGGGGVPVFEHKDKHLEAIEAVIDKDLASSLLATEIGADAFYIITDVPKVYVKFNTPQQKALNKVTVKQMMKYQEEGEFAAGSMAPKVLAGVDFVRNGGHEAVITSAEELDKDNCGTRIVNQK